MELAKHFCLTTAEFHFFQYICPKMGQQAISGVVCLTCSKKSVRVPKWWHGTFINPRYTPFIRDREKELLGGVIKLFISEPFEDLAARLIYTYIFLLFVAISRLRKDERMYNSMSFRRMWYDTM